MILRKKLNMCITTAVIVLTASSAFAVQDAIIAVVNDELITLRDLKDYIRTTYIELAARGLSEEELQKVIIDMEINGINQLIEEKLILSKANTLGLTVKETLVDDKIAEIKKKYDSEQVFLDSLIQHGATLSDLRQKILNQLKIKYVIDYEIRSKIYINPKDITEFYKNNTELFKKKERISLDSIFVPKGDNPVEGNLKIEEASMKLSDGQPFEQVAKEFSSMPPIGVVERGQLMANIENVVFSLKENEISKPVEVDNGYYIFQLKGRVPSKTASLEEVSEQIRNILYNERFQKDLRAWIDQLKKEAFIEIKE